MDISYLMKGKLVCQDCKIDLKYKEDHAYNEWIAICLCGKEYVISLDVRPHTPEVECDCEKEMCGICSHRYCDHNDCKCYERNMR